MGALSKKFKSFGEGAIYMILFLVFVFSLVYFIFQMGRLSMFIDMYHVVQSSVCKDKFELKIPDSSINFTMVPKDVKSPSNK